MDVEQRRQAAVATMEWAVSDAGAGEYAARAIVGSIRPGTSRTVVVVGQQELFTSDGRTGVLPERGDVVLVHVGGGGAFQLVVDAAAFGNGLVVLSGVPSNGAVPEWTVYESPRLLQRVSMPGDDEGEMITVGTSWSEPFENTWPADGAAWDEGSVLIGSMAEFEALYGAAPAYVPLSVREGGWGKRAGWRLSKLRERVALRLAPWLRRRRCRECGCTDSYACSRGASEVCSWAAADLCSACVPDAEPGWHHPSRVGA